MKRTVICLTTIFSLLIFNPLTHAATKQITITQQINQAIENFDQPSNIGIAIQALDSNKIIYQRNANLVFNTASAMKLFTAVAALTYLGPDFKFITQLTTDQSPVNGILSGNLYIKFTGDPELKTEDLNNLVNALAQKGIHTINGNLIIDDTALDRNNWGPGWMWDEQAICYAAPATAIIVNENCFAATLQPGKQINTAPLLQVPPNLTGAIITNEAATKTAAKPVCPLDLRSLGNNHYRLSGCVTPDKQPLPLQIALDNPALAATHILLTLFKQHRILFNGAVVYGKTPADTILFATHHSAPLSALIKSMLKNSDNLMADVIFKTLGAHYFHTTGTWTNGAAAVKAILTTKTGIDFNKLVMVDGAGLSRYNLVSPEQFIKLINYAYHVSSIKNVLYQALPVLGIDGTLENRLKNTPYAGKIHAKTGTMASTSSLVGYAQTSHQQMLAFAILINGFVGQPETYQSLEDQICKILIQA